MNSPAGGFCVRGEDCFKHVCVHKHTLEKQIFLAVSFLVCRRSLPDLGHIVKGETYVCP